MSYYTAKEVNDTYMIEKIDDDHFQVMFLGWNSEEPYDTYPYRILQFDDAFILSKAMIEDFDFDIMFETMEDSFGGAVFDYNEERFLFHYGDEDICTPEEFRQLVMQNKCPSAILLKM